MRGLDELVDATNPGWPLVADILGRATNKAEVLPVRREDGERTLVGVQVTTRSPRGRIRT
jgi:hypothetical protein